MAALRIAAGLAPLWLVAHATAEPSAAAVRMATALDAGAAPAATPPLVTHSVMARVARGTARAAYLPIDTDLDGAGREHSIRVRFRVQNTGDAPTTILPRLDYRAAPDGRFAPVPDAAPALGAPLRLWREWVAAPHGRGTVPGPVDAPVPVAGLIIGDAPDAGLTPVAGLRLAGRPGEPLPLPAHSATEVEFRVRITMDAEYLATYELRLADGDVPAAGGVVARVTLGAAPEPLLSPGQREGTPMAPPTRPPRQETRLRYRLVASGPSRAGASPAASSPVRTAAEVSGPHGPYSTTADQCASCHRSHTAQSANQLPLAGPQANLCLTCHDGTGATTNVAAQYTDATVPANNAATRSYYRHDALTASAHTQSGQNEFGGVLNRHSECGDCHDPHRVTSAASTQTTAGWTAGGRLAGTSGVAMTPGTGGAPPTYTFLDGEQRAVTLEYQLCLKCHSGFTTLPSNTGFTPSRYVLDKGVELDPANASSHPVARPGTNATAKMDASLAGTSPYKQWNFTSASTIRCSSCHVSGTRFNAALPPAGAVGAYDPPGAGADMPPHTSKNRSLLILPYRDRVLKSSTERYAAADFALCYACHAEQPFSSQTSTATNFRLHGMHLTGITGQGNGGTDIDTAGAGQSNAICAECHFRLHSSAYPDPGQTLNGQRLVNFAPNVRPSGTVRSWTKTATGGSCTLTCHGKGHSGERY